MYQINVTEIKYVVLVAAEVKDLAIYLGISIDQTSIKEYMNERVKRLSPRERQTTVELLEDVVNFFRLDERFQKLTHGGVTFVSETFSVLTRVLKSAE